MSPRLFSSRGGQCVLVDCEHVSKKRSSESAWTPPVCASAFSPTERVGVDSVPLVDWFPFFWPHDGAVDRLPVATFRNGALIPA